MAFARLTCKPRTLADALACLRGKPAIRIAHNTTLARTADGGACVIYHATPVLTFHPDGTTTATTGGFRTRTTAARLRGLGLPLAIKGGEWFLLRGDCPAELVPWSDGMAVELD